MSKRPSKPTHTRSIWMTLPLLATLVLAAGCQTTQGIGTIGKPVCLIWQSIDYSGSKDTPETIDAVRVNNARRDAYCGE